MEIVFVRHGRTELNKRGCYLGTTDDELCSEGVIEIKRLRNCLNGVNFDMVYSSPLKRARQSAEIIGRDFVIDERLREFNFGIFEGLKNSDVQKKYPGEYLKWSKDYLNYKIPEGESLFELFNRVENFIKDISEKYQRVLVFTHGGVIRCAMSLAFNSRDDFYKFQVNHGTINILTINGGYRFIKLLNAYWDLKEILS